MLKEIRKIHDLLLKDRPLDDHKEYTNGVLDMYNEIKKLIEVKAKND